MLLRLHARRQALLVIVRIDVDPCLNDGGSGIEVFGHEMHGRAVLRLVRFEDAPVGVQAREFRQQRGVNVQDSSRIVRDEGRG